MSSYSLKQADGGVWYIRWTEGRRSKRVSTRTKDLAGAKSFLATWLTLEAEGAPAAAITCGEAWNAYWRGHFLKKKLPRSVRVAEYIWQNLEGYFASLPVRSITQAVIDDYIASRAVGLIGRPSVEQTAAHELTLLRASWRWCARRELLPADDIKFFTLPGRAAPRDRWLTKEEVARVFAAAEQMRLARRDRLRLVLSRTERFVWLAHHTAARKSAILALTWDRVDFETGVINYVEPGRVVTKKRRVAVPISSALRPVLERAYAERTSDLVMTTGSDLNENLKRLARLAGVGHLHPHLFRHTAATHMARSGVDLWRIAGVLGDTIETVTRNYLKHCPEHLRSAVQTLHTERPTMGAAPKMGVENDLQQPTLARSDLSETPAIRPVH